MLMRVLCAFALVAFVAMSSARSQDIEPQFIPRPTTTEGSGIKVDTTTTELPTTTTETSETTTATTEVEDTTLDMDTTTTEEAKTTTIAPTAKTTTPRPVGRKPFVCRFIQQRGAPFFDWRSGVYVIPAACYFCCSCSTGSEHCFNVSRHYCRSIY